MCNNIEFNREETFVNLHLHTTYSLLDSTNRPEDVVKKVKANNQRGYAVTEHGNCYSSVRMSKLAKQNSLKFIYGCEFYICDNRFEKDKTNKYYHLTILAKNEQGRLNMNKLVTLANLEGFYFKPRIDFELLSQYKEGLIILSGCMASELQQTLAGGKIGNGDVEITSGNIERAKEVARRYHAAFGEDYYMEVQSHRDIRQQQLNRVIVDMAKELGIQWVATADSHFTNEEDLELHSIFIAINRNQDSYESDSVYKDTQIQTEKEAWNLLISLTEEERDIAIRNTALITDKCDARIPLSAALIPNVKIPEGFDTQEAYLKHLCNEGWTYRRINRKDKKLIQQYRERLMYEYNAITEMGFAGYYLLVYGYANSVKRRGIARGSGGGSLVAYLLNIVDIDPIKYGLYFERFIDVAQLDLLKEGRITREELKIPDFDLDFGTHERELVMKNIIEEHGEEHVAALGQFGYIWDKSAVKDIGRVLGIPFDITNQITKELGDDKLKDVIDTGIFKEWSRQYPKLFDYAQRVAGLPRSFGMHPCFTKGHLVMTNNGYKQIQDITLGDYIFTHENRFEIVTDVMKSFSDNIYKVKIMGSEALEVTGNHPFYVKERKNKRIKTYGEPVWKCVNELVKGDVIGVAVNKESIIPNNLSLPFDNNDFWWLIGRYIGDGWTFERRDGIVDFRTIICANKNGEIKEVENICKKLFNYTIMKDKTVDKLSINNKKLFDFVNTLGKYAYGKKITKDIINLPVDKLKSFLEGYFSADGYITKQKYQTFKTVGRELAYGLQACIHKVYNTVCSITVIPEKQELIDGRLVNSKTKYALSFKDYVAKKDRSFYENGYLWVPFKEKMLIENFEDEVYNFTVDKDNSYTINNLIVHNCGKVVTIDKTTYYTALSFNDGQAVLQGDMKDAESLGLVKIDMLGLRTIDVIYDTLEMLGKDYSYISPDTLNFSDEKVLEIFRQGFTDGVFQFESDGMKSTLKKMKPSGESGLNDLSVVNALYRPGSMKFIDNYIKRKFGMEDFKYLHEDLRSILEISYAIIVFQEQLIEIGRNAGMRNPDLLRQATGKKDIEKLKLVEPELRGLLYGRGWTEEQFNEMWEIMLEFAKYSFNKAHSQAYAIIAYICAFLKAYHPVEFMCAWLNSLEGHHDKLETAYKEAKRLGVKFNPISFRNPTPICKVEDGGITYGLTLIKHCNRSIAEDLMLLKDNNYKHFVDLMIDIKERTTLNSKQLDILVKLGMFHEFGENKRLLEIIETFTGSKIKYDKKHKDKTKEKRIAALYEYEEGLMSNEKLQPLEQINIEKEYYGFIKSIYPEIDKRIVAILEVDKKYTPKAISYRLHDGEMFEFKIYKADFFGSKDRDAFVVGDLVKIGKLEQREKVKMGENGKWNGTGDMEWILKKCSIVSQETLALQL